MKKLNLKKLHNQNLLIQTFAINETQTKEIDVCHLSIHSQIEKGSAF